MEGGLGEQRLLIGLSASEGVEVDEAGMEVQFAADEAVRPQGIDGEAVAQELGAASLVGAA